MSNLYHNQMNEHERLVVDYIFEVVSQCCKSKNISIAFDDRAETFVEAIAQYLKDSNVNLDDVVL